MACGETSFKWKKKAHDPFGSTTPSCEGSCDLTKIYRQEGQVRKELAVSCLPILRGTWEDGFQPEIVPAVPEVKPSGTDAGRSAVPANSKGWECACVIEQLKVTPGMGDGGNITTFPAPKAPDYYINKNPVTGETKVGVTVTLVQNPDGTVGYVAMLK
jgi:hypothetical protein